MSAGPRFNAVSAPSVKDTILQRLTEAIVTGKLKPGERLNETQLSNDFGVSRVPIREALQHLQEKGLVMNSPRRGMFVVTLSDEEIQQISSIRLILEAEALKLCRMRLTPPVEKRLAQLAGKLDEADSTSAEATAGFDLEFHETIWRTSGNPQLVKSLHNLIAPVFAHRLFFTDKYDAYRWTMKHHRVLLDFVRGASDRTAESVMLEHLSFGYTY